MPRAIRLAGAHADIVSVFPALPSGKIGWPGWAEGSTIEYFVEKARWASEGARRAGRNPDGLDLSTQLTHTAVGDDPAPLQELIRQATDVTPVAQDEAMIFLTGTPVQACERLERRREATGISYHVVFDPAFNYAYPDGPPALAGDAGPDAGDRHLERFAQAIIRPLAGQ